MKYEFVSQKTCLEACPETPKSLASFPHLKISPNPLVLVCSNSGATAILTFTHHPIPVWSSCLRGRTSCALVLWQWFQCSCCFYPVLSPEDLQFPALQASCCVQMVWGCPWLCFGSPTGPSSSAGLCATMSSLGSLVGLLLTVAAGAAFYASMSALTCSVMYVFSIF